MDRVLAARGDRATIVGATSGDTGGAAIEAFRGSARVDVAIVLFPQGRVSDVQRRMMTTPTEENVHAVAVRRHLRRLPGAGEGDVQRPRLPRPHCAAGVNSINWARIAGQVSYYFAAAAALGAPAPPGVVRGADRQLRRHLRRLRGQAHGPADRAAGDRHQRQRHPAAARSRTGIYEMREVVATTSPSMDIQISSNFERYPVRGLGPRCRLVRAKMGGLAAERRFDRARRSP